MELRLNIGLNQIAGLLQELPYDDKLVLKSQLDKELSHKKKDTKNTLNKLLLSGPVMTEEGYSSYKDFRKQFGKWSKKLSV